MMPLTHTRVFRVRHYECDAYGHLNNTNYLRYMQETALDASAAAGYDLARYQALGCYWLVRQTTIDYLRPLAYGDSVEVKTWVIGYGRVRSRRAYEFRRAADGKLVAQAETDWVFIDVAAGRPALPPPELKAAFFPEGVPEALMPAEEFPPLPPPPPGVFTTRRRAAWRDIDPLQHVNNAVYLAYMEDCGVDAAAAHGWPLSRLLSEGIGIIARQHRIEYRQPAVLDDELELTTWLSNLTTSTCIRHYLVARPGDNSLLAQASTLWIFVDLASGRPMPIPDRVRQDLAPNVGSDAA